MKQNPAHGASDRLGFTLLELVIVLTIAGVIIGLGAPQLQAALHQRDVSGARDGVLLLSKRARALAMERGRRVEFVLDTDAGRAVVMDGSDTLDVLNFEDERGVTASAAGDEYRLCYMGRGFATQPCTTVEDVVTVTFARANHSAELEIWPLGQMTKP